MPKLYLFLSRIGFINGFAYFHTTGESDGPDDFDGNELDLDMNADDLNAEADMVDAPSPTED